MMTLPLLSLSEIPPLKSPLEKDSVVVVVTPFSQHNLCDYVHYLSPHDYDVSQKYKFQKDRDRYLIVRGILQVLLRRYFGSSMSAFDISIGKYGKPFISDSCFSFNLSHSLDFLVCVFSYLPTIGVDIEASRIIRNPLSLCKRFLSKYNFDVLSSSQHLRDDFLKIWTQKEAYIKAIGRGISYGLDRFDVFDDTLSFTINDRHQSTKFYGQYFTCDGIHLSVVYPRKHEMLYQDFLNSV